MAKNDAQLLRSFCITCDTFLGVRRFVLIIILSPTFAVYDTEKANAQDYKSKMAINEENATPLKVTFEYPFYAKLSKSLRRDARVIIRNAFHSVKLFK